MGYINYCQQLRMGIRLFPCCLTALLTRKTESPHCPVGMGKNPLLDPFKGNSGICIKTSLFALKLRNGNDLQRFLNKTLPNVFFLSSAPFSNSQSAFLPYFCFVRSISRYESCTFRSDHHPGSRSRRRRSRPLPLTMAGCSRQASNGIPVSRRSADRSFQQT